LFLGISLKKRALQIGLPRDIDGPMKIQMASDYYKQVDACVRTIPNGHIYQPPNAHVRISGILLSNAMAAAVKKIYIENH
jgi:hypothetical protein